MLDMDEREENERRARSAIVALDAFCNLEGRSFMKALVQESDPGVPIADLLANLMHLCDQRGWDFDFYLERAKRNFDEEKIDG